MGNVATFKELEKSIIKNGWVLIRVVGLHHIYSKEGFKPVAIPRHNKDMRKGTVNSILKQTGLK